MVELRRGRPRALGHLLHEDVLGREVGAEDIALGGRQRQVPAADREAGRNRVHDLPLVVEVRAVELVVLRALGHGAAVVAGRLRIGAAGHDVEGVDIDLVVARAVVLGEQADPEAAGLVQVLLDVDRLAELGERRPIGRRPRRDRPRVGVVDESDPRVVAGEVERAGVRPRDRLRRDRHRAAVRGEDPLGPLAVLVTRRVGIGVGLVLDRGLDEVVRVEAVDQRQPGRLAVGVDVGVGDLRRRHPRVSGRLLQQHLGRPVAAEQIAGDHRQRQVTVADGRLGAGDRIDELPLRVELGAVELVRERVALPGAVPVGREPDVLVGRGDLAVHAERADVDRSVRGARRSRPRSGSPAGRCTACR